MTINGKCPECGGECWRDEVDIGVGVQYGPWNCSECGWYEGWRVDAMIDAERDEETFRGSVLPSAGAVRRPATYF